MLAIVWTCENILASFVSHLNEWIEYEGRQQPFHDEVGPPGIIRIFPWVSAQHDDLRDPPGNTGLWLVDTYHVTWILASDWLCQTSLCHLCPRGPWHCPMSDLARFSTYYHYALTTEGVGRDTRGQLRSDSSLLKTTDISRYQIMYQNWQHFIAQGHFTSRGTR